MKMKHILLEVYCEARKNHNITHCLVNGGNEISSSCFSIDCEFLSYTHCSNEVAFAGEGGIVEGLDDFIGFGGEMEPETNDELDRTVLIDKWKEICRKKIAEAYDEYMIFKKRHKY